MKARVIAFYLPQFHPIPENDKWWGKGFTEWTNVGKAKPLFRGHYQPRVPADLGYYDLRVAETRQAQAEMAREAGIEGFCYWHYWFGNGKRLLERPFDEVLSSGKPDFPFCLGWANETWKGFAHGLTNRNILIEQHYLGIEDYTAHFKVVLPAFLDSRYIKVDNKPVFLIYRPLDSPEVANFIKVWRSLAKENGLPGIHFVGHHSDVRNSIDSIFQVGVDAVNTLRLRYYMYYKRNILHKSLGKIYHEIVKKPYVYSYSNFAKYFLDYNADSLENIYPSIISGWDHTPRSGCHGLVLDKFTPEAFERHVKEVIDIIGHKSNNHRIVFLKSWNEWAEGNYVEPDLRYGKGFIDVLRKYIVG